MGVVYLEGNVVDADQVTVEQTHIVFDEAGDHVLTKYIARLLATVALVGPSTVVPISEVSALQQIGHPTNTTF